MHIAIDLILSETKSHIIAQPSTLAQHRGAGGTAAHHECVLHIRHEACRARAGDVELRGIDLEASAAAAAAADLQLLRDSRRPALEVIRLRLRVLRQRCIQQPLARRLQHACRQETW